MQITAPTPPKRPAENVIAMINVVFLLLVFFLISARITPPMPVAVEPPQAEGQEIDLGPDTLLIGPDGTLYFADAVGDAALAALTGRESDTPLTLRVDRALAGAKLATHLRDISAATEAPVSIVVEP